LFDIFVYFSVFVYYILWIDFFIFVQCNSLALQSLFAEMICFCMVTIFYPILLSLFVCLFVCLFALWCLMQLPTIFRLYRSGHFYWWRTGRKPPTCLKSLEKTILSWTTCVWSFCHYLDNKICLN
jgi:hypothetical protein